MFLLLQRVTHANVLVDKKIIATIDKGILIFIGIEPNDTEIIANKMLHKVVNYRIFADKDDKMNLSLQDVNGGLLLVPQFTLAADTKKGMRPSFTTAASPVHGKKIFSYMIENAIKIISNNINVQSGEFGANMQIELCNDGPVTFLLHG